VVIFRTEEAHGAASQGGVPGNHMPKREALPWWIFGVLGGFLAVWFGPELLDHFQIEWEMEEGPSALLNLKSAALFSIGMVAGGVLGWFIIKPVNFALGAFFRGFNRGFDRMTQAYGRVVGYVLRLSVLVLLIYVGLLALTGWQFSTAPVGFIP